MSRYRNEPEYTHGAPACTGVLITNLGTPDAPTPAALRRYLAEFLWDPRVVEMPRALWWLLLHGVILRSRPRRAAHAYRKVWTDEGSPLLAISRRQESALQESLKERFRGPVTVALGMRYGNPSIAMALDQLNKAHARRLLVLPLYPQYSAATTASTFDAVTSELQRWRWQPELRFINHYHDEPLYIRAVANSIRDYWNANGEPQHLLLSFHGLPRRYLLAGDPYHCECHKSARLIAEHLRLPPDRWQLCFQSRFGREEWLQPYTDSVLKELPQRGVRHVDVVCPGFAADCLETLEEIAIQNRDAFLRAGGEQYRYVPALNASRSHLHCLTELVARHTQAWPETDPGWDAIERADESNRSRRLALGAGAKR